MPTYSDYAEIEDAFNFTNSTALPSTYITPDGSGVYTFSYSFLTSESDLISTDDYDTDETGQDLDSQSAVYSLEYATFSAFSALQQDAAEIIMHVSGEYDYTFSAFFSDVTHVVFASDEPEDAHISFGQAVWSDGDSGTGSDSGVRGWTKTLDPVSAANFAALFPQYDHSLAYAEGAHGDIWLNSGSSLGWASIDEGGVQFYTILHEIGHSLGLRHPTAESPDTPDIDSLKYTIMSEEFLPGMVDGGNVVLPSGLQLFDIVALQEIYGSRNHTTRSDATTYTVAAGFGATTSTPFIYTIWDGGNTDTISASAYSVHALIDLRQGNFSSIGLALDTAFEGEDLFAFDFLEGQAQDNVAIAYDTVIENATGSVESENGDLLIGNGWENVLTGLSGNDVLFGDGFVYDGVTGSMYSESADDDAPLLAADNDTLNPGVGQDISYGGYGDDLFIGAAVLGSLEGDVYHGGGFEAGGTEGAGDELDYEEDGSDTVDYGALLFGVRIDLTDLSASTTYKWTAGSGTVGTADELVSIENAVGTAYDDSFIGTEGLQNRFEGGDGIDTIDYSAYADGVIIDLNGEGGSGEDILTDIEKVVGSEWYDQFIDAPGVANQLDGGRDFDTIYYSAHTTGVIVNLEDGTDSDGNTLLNIEDVVGSAEDDTIIDDAAIGDGGRILDGGDGIDTLDYSQWTEGVVVDAEFEDGIGLTMTVDHDYAYDEGSGQIWKDSPGTYAYQVTEWANSLTSIEAFIGSSFNDWFLDGYEIDNAYDGGEGFDVLVLGNIAGETDLTNGIITNDDHVTIESVMNIEGLLHTTRMDFVIDGDTLEEILGEGFWGEGDELDGVWITLGPQEIVYRNPDTGDFEFLTNLVNQKRWYSYEEHGWNDIWGAFPGWKAVLSIVNADGELVSQTVLDEQVSVDDFSFWGIGGVGDDDLTGDRTGDPLDDDMEGGAGNDTMAGGGGNDTMDGGAGNDDLDGGSGDDTLYAGDGDDTVDGGSGDDTLIAGSGAGNDSYDGGADIDTIVYSSTTAGITVDLSAGSNHATGTEIDTDQIGNVENVIGGSGNDTITGDGANNVIEGAGGNDTLTGGSGTDTASYAGAAAGVTVGLANGSAQNTVGAGTDTLSGFENLAGSTHGDTLTGSSAANTLSGNDGDDILAGGAGSDTLDGGDGADTADYRTAASAVTVNLSTGTTSNDGDSSSDTLVSIERVIGSAGADSITGDSGDNVIEGAGGNDTLVGGLGTDTLSYAHAASAVTVNLATTSAQNTVGAGTDTVSGFENLTGSAYNDTLTGDTGGNVIDGGGGNDLIKGSTGNDTLDGGSGTDTVTFAGASAVTVSLAAGTATGDGTDTLANFENVTGSSNGDTITGDAGANTLDGGNGNDTIAGGAGNDTLIGGAGTDTVDYSAAVSGVTVDLSTGTASDGSGGTDTLSGFEHIIGSAHNDTLTGSTATNTINGGAGNDTIYGLGNADDVNGGDGNDTIYGDAGNDDLDGDGGDDTIYGGDSADTIYGDAGNDLIYAGDGNDASVQGGDGNDVIYGDAGNDTIRGNSQNDILYGGDGADTLEGQTDSDILYGGDGLDTLSGQGSGGGTDGYNVFVFEAASAFNNTDVITDFGTGATYYDMIDITSLMSSYTAGVDDIDDFIYIHVSGSDSYLAVDANGGGDAFVDVAKLQGVTGLASVEALVASRRILIADENVIFGSTATETINGTSGVDMIFGITGNDTIYAGAGSDFIKTEVGNQTIYGEGGNDVIESGNNNDYLDGGDGDDSLTGGFGSDTFVGGAGTDTILWGAVSDYVIVYRENANYLTVRDTSRDDVDHVYNDVEAIQFNDVTLDLTAVTFALNGVGWGTAKAVNGTGNAETHYGFNAIDIIDGSGGNDTIYGYYGDDILSGGNGGDTLYGGEGDDILKGGALSDTLDGGNGTDTADYSDAASGVTVSLSSGTQSGGSVGNDTLTAIENVLGSAYGDTITGDGGANVLTGGAGGDTLNGGSGADTLYGGDGADTLYGNGGADTFVFEAATAFNNVDTVSGFSTGDTDKIDIADILDGVYDYGVDSILDFVKIEDSGSDSVLKIDADGGGDSFVTIATLLGITGLTDEAGLESAGTLITH